MSAEQSPTRPPHDALVRAAIETAEISEEPINLSQIIAAANLIHSNRAAILNHPLGN